MMIINSTDTELDFRPTTKRIQQATTVSPEQLPPSIDPVILKKLILNVHIKYDKDGHVEKLLEKLMEPYKHLPRDADGQHLSVLQQYALISTSQSIDISNQSERVTYEPNLFIKKNDAFGPWNFNHLLTLLKVEYQCDSSEHKEFPCVWKTDSKTTVRIQVIKQNENESTKDQNSIKSPKNTEDATLQGFLKTICRYFGRNESIATEWLEAFKGESIATVEHLRIAVANEKVWDAIETVKYIVKQMIRDYVQLSDPSVASNQTNDIYKESDATLFGDIHRIRRYFHYVTKTLQHISYLDRGAVDQAIVEIRKTYDDDGNVLNNIHGYLRTFCLETKTMDKEAHEKRRQGWEDEKTKLINENEKLTKEVIIAEQEIKGPETEVEIYQAQLINVEKENEKTLADRQKLITEAAGLDRCKQAKEWTTKRDQATTKAKKAAEKVDLVKEKLKQAQAKLALLSEPILRKKTTIAENNDKIRNLTAFLNINGEEAQKKLNVKYGRGLLLYGPPGTGKSELLKRAAIFAGITMTTTALAAGELNRPYVGETERLLVDIMYRSHTIPYLICAMTIDEIDGLVPKRTNNAQQSKVDGISVLLSHIEGVKNIPNLIVLGATNRRNMMDEAFLRRMQAKCFVGRPSPEIRKKMLEPLLYMDAEVFNSRVMDFLMKITTNFSGAAVGALKSSIIVAMDTYAKSGGLSDKIFLDLADNAAREFSCWFGIGTLPEICRLNPNIFASNNKQEEYSLKLPNNDPTGRILVDLIDRKCLIEFKAQPTMDIDLNPEETSTMSLLSRFISGCSSRNIDTIQIIDMNFLTKNNAFENNQIFELLTTTFEECEEYNRSMLIFDIDSLIILSINDSATSVSTSISNIQLYQFIREKCKKAVVEQKTIDENGDTSKNEQVKEKWMIMIVKHPFLRGLLIDDIEFKPTLRQTEQGYEDERKRQQDVTPKICPKCQQSYIPAEAKHGSCHYHDGFIVNLETEKAITEDEAHKIMQSAKLVASSASHDDPNNKPKIPQLIWACCLRVFASEPPCKVGICGLPEDLKEEALDPTKDLITNVQEHFQKNEKPKKKIDEFLTLHRQRKREMKAVQVPTAPKQSTRPTYNQFA